MNLKKLFFMVLAPLIASVFLFFGYYYFKYEYISVSENMHIDEKVLSKAINTGNLKVIKIALERGINPNKFINGRTMLNFTIWTGHNKERIVKYLLKNGANINARPLNDGYRNLTPLMEAASVPSADIVKLLIEFGADISVVDDYGNTALFYVTGRPPEHDTCKVIKVLIESGINISHKNNDGYIARIKGCEEPKANKQ